MKWDIKLSDGRNHTLVFNHNTLSGRRTIVFDGKTLRTTVSCQAQQQRGLLLGVDGGDWRAALHCAACGA